MPPAWARALHHACGGLPGLAAEVVRVAAGGGDPLAVDPAAVADGAVAVATALAARLDDDPGRDVARALAIWRGRAPADRVLATAGGTGGAGGAAALGALIAAGLVGRDGDDVTLRDAVATALRARLGDDDRRALAARAITAGRADGLADADLAVQLLDAGAPEAADAAVAAATWALRAGSFGAARALADAALAAAGDAPATAAQARLLVARAATGVADYRARALPPSPPPRVPTSPTTTGPGPG
ncbi:MAG: hypothetical protein H6708_26150 [Kofleriaceae bacterium]|nr:hypothetical protein [Kofleriaceae bacterium]